MKFAGQQNSVLRKEYRREDQYLSIEMQPYSQYALVRMTPRGRTFFALWLTQTLFVVKYPLLTWV